MKWNTSTKLCCLLYIQIWFSISLLNWLGEGGDDLTAYRSSNNGCWNVWGFAGGTSSEVLKIVTEHEDQQWNKDCKVLRYKSDVTLTSSKGLKLELFRFQNLSDIEGEKKKKQCQELNHKNQIHFVFKFTFSKRLINCLMGEQLSAPPKSLLLSINFLSQLTDVWVWRIARELWLFSVGETFSECLGCLKWWACHNFSTNN